MNRGHGHYERVRSIGTGEPVICGGVSVPVLRVIAHGPGQHRGPIRADLYAVEIVTANGSRWWGSVTQPTISGDLRMWWNAP